MVTLLCRMECDMDIDDVGVATHAAESAHRLRSSLVENHNPYLRLS